MAGFAERMGYRETRSLVQSDELDEDTRTALWNAAEAIKRAADTTLSASVQGQMLRSIWQQEWHQAADEYPGASNVWRRIKVDITGEEWFNTLDLIEALIGYVSRLQDARAGSLVENATAAFNKVFEQYLVGYRFIESKITPIDSAVSIDAVATALSDTEDLAGAHKHLEQALDLLSDRQTPDYPNSVKESISAVEAVCKTFTTEGTLGAALKKLEAAGVTIHPALKGAWSQMYGWTSDADGIRHGGIDPAEVDQALAKYMLVTCSAFVSHLIEAGRKAGLV